LKEGAFCPSFRFGGDLSTTQIVDDDITDEAMILFRKRVTKLTESTLERFVTRARKVVRLKGGVDVLVTSNVEMRRLNRQFRRKDKPTDVLSFPAEANSVLAGEIALSAEIAARNARALGHSTAEEVKILVLHGILHLRGYDHERDDGQMARLEKQLRASLRLPCGLIERTVAPRRLPKTRKPVSVRGKDRSRRPPGVRK
jgi:probable rRNA maturation factor